MATVIFTLEQFSPKTMEVMPTKAEFVPQSSGTSFLKIFPSATRDPQIIILRILHLFFF